MNRQEFPVLYKKTNTGAIQTWAIAVYEAFNGADIVTVFGQLNTDKPQTTTDKITEGKNTGKKNATTPYQQAEKEAKAKWEKQKKKGYVESIEAAQAEELDELIEGGIVPMLAHKYSDHAHKIKYPAYVQPKLDGIRCIAIIDNGSVTLWTRTRKQITSMPHIVEELRVAFGGPYNKMILDGELYNHNFKNNFEHIVSLVRQEEPDPQAGDVEYHVYDCVTDGTFEERLAVLNKGFETYALVHIKQVQTRIVETEDEVMGFFDRFRELGYEGAMLRNAGSKYVNKRSYDLQKVKEFDDAEFPIIGIEEGRGKLAGHVGSFICRTPAGKEFLAKMSGDTSNLKKYFEDSTLWTGKVLTVQYQGLTGKEGVPRFPVGIAIRNYE